MRRMTRQAALVGLHRRVFKDERTHCVGMALSADRKLTCGGTNLMSGLRAVRIMAVAALHQADVDPVTVRPGELSPLRRVAAIAQVGLRLYKHEVHVAGLVGTVARGATDAVRQVLGLGEILRLQARLVTFGTDRRGLGRSQCFKANDFGDVATAIYVRLRRTVT